MTLGRLLLRTAVGGLFVGHGTQKLFGWFDGPGLDATAQMFGQIGMRPPRAHAIAAGVGEAGSGAALVLGAQTPLASSAIIATMITAIRKVHLRNGVWVTDQGYEYNLVLIAAALALAETGPGSLSVDAATGSERRGAKWALISLALGIAGSLCADLISKLVPEPSGESAGAGAGEAPAPTDVADASAPAGENGASAD